MKAASPYILFLLALLHIIPLYYLGMSFISTTILFYYALYLLMRPIQKVFRTLERREWVLKNIQVLFIFLLVTEFILLFIAKIGNTYTENKYGIYTSEYHKTDRIALLNSIGFKKIRLNYTNGYQPGSTSIHKTGEFEYPISYNNTGFRGISPARITDSTIFRIVVLGDSFTEGFGAPDDSTFTERLKHHLGGRPGTIEVFNAGICGSNPAYEIELYKKKFRDYPANLVIMVSNLTDVSDIEYTLRKSEIPVTEYFIAVSHIFRIVYWGIFHHEMTISNASDAITGRRDENLAVLVRMIDSFNDSLAGNHQLFKLFYLPMTIELYNFKGNTPTSSLIDSYHHASLPLTDLRGAYKKNIGPRDSLFNYYWKIDGHHTSRGYDLMATCVADEIKHYFTTDTSGKYFTTHSINP